MGRPCRQAEWWPMGPSDPCGRVFVEGRPEGASWSGPGILLQVLGVKRSRLCSETDHVCVSVRRVKELAPLIVLASQVPGAGVRSSLRGQVFLLRKPGAFAPFTDSALEASSTGDEGRPAVFGEFGPSDCRCYHVSRMPLEQTYFGV